MLLRSFDFCKPKNIGKKLFRICMIINIEINCVSIPKVEPVYKYEPKTTVDWAVQNDNKPLWTRSPKEVRGDDPVMRSGSERGRVSLGNSIFAWCNEMASSPDLPDLGSKGQH